MSSDGAPGFTRLPGLKHYTENTGDVDMAYLFFGGNPTDPDAGFHEPVKD